MHCMPGDVAIWRTGVACSRRMARMKEELTWMRITVFDGSFQLRFFIVHAFLDWHSHFERWPVRGISTFLMQLST